MTPDAQDRSDARMVTDAEAADSLRWHRRSASQNTCGGCGNGWPCVPSRLLADRARWIELAKMVMHSTRAYGDEAHDA